MVTARAPQAIYCLDPYHLVAWVTDALDQVRRQVWNSARGGPGRRTSQSRQLKSARWALWRNPEHLTDKQRSTLATIQTTNRPLYRAYQRGYEDGLRHRPRAYVDQLRAVQQSWQTAYWHGKTLRRERGMFDANFYDVETEE